MAPTGRPPLSADRSPTDDGPLVELGPIVNRHGLAGEVRLLSYNPESTTATAVSHVVLIDRSGRREVRGVRGVRRHKRFVLLRLEGVESAAAAEALVGYTVAVPRSALPAIDPGAVYHTDLLGCAVETTQGEQLGTVREMLVTGSNDVCVVRGAGREVLVPLIADVVAELDVAGRRLIIRPLPGLLDEGN